jgi:hypothetical protein
LRHAADDGRISCIKSVMFKSPPISPAWSARLSAANAHTRRAGLARATARAEMSARGRRWAPATHHFSNVL